MFSVLSLSWNYLFEHINNMQCYELPFGCRHWHLTLNYAQLCPVYVPLKHNLLNLHPQIGFLRRDKETSFVLHMFCTLLILSPVTRKVPLFSSNSFSIYFIFHNWLFNGKAQVEIFSYVCQMVSHWICRMTTEELFYVLWISCFG